MQNSQRAEFNPAIETAIAAANRLALPVLVGFGLTDNYPEANARHYAFMLEGLAVDVQELVRLGLEGARVVVLNLPHNASASQISDLAALAGCNALVQYLYVSDFPASFGQAPAYFFGRSGSGHGRTAGCQERRQRLTLDGQRIS